MKKLSFVLLMLLAFGVTALLALPQDQAGQPADQMENDIVNTIRLAPHYGVFDSFSFKMDGNNVTLLGQAMLPITKEEVFRRVAKVAGIGTVYNKIEVLPLSKRDDRIRLEVYRNLFGTADLYRYALSPDPSIHIIVKDGNVKLEGVVSNEGDSKFALMAVRRVNGILSVTDNLKIEK
jgi:osmotically-inducible protein OsmY